MRQEHPEVVVAGVGQTPVGELWDISLRELAVEAILAALKDAGGLRPQAIYIGNMLAVSASRQANLGALLAEDAGLTGVEGVTVEAADASGGAALRMATIAVRSGAVDTALALGVEKTTDVIGSESETFISQMLDADFEAAQGLTPISLAGLLFHRYLTEYSPDRMAFGGFPETAHANGATNSFAIYQRAMRNGLYEQRAAKEAEVLNMFDVAPYA
ncbi:MAG: beta-ketoacyl synthase N-terminal-like domain-containing protein, partial [Brevefilum sp.]